ncbi:MAG TPA: diguanylate cyclase, partial [Vicinamibacterales bacterium]|nr:diguanylate cyclase [Vicinamibacterales bacterium]
RRAATRLSDLAARYGGEEFAVVLIDTSPEGALTVAEFVRRSVEELQIPHSASPFGVLTVSVGVATRSDERFPRMGDLVVACDKALYESKAHGRNRVSVEIPE